MAQLNNNEVRKVYLLTHSQADTERFNHESFAKIVATAFQAVTTALIIQWACYREHHMDAGVRFHMCVLLSKLQGGKKVKVGHWSKIITFCQKKSNFCCQFCKVF